MTLKIFSAVEDAQLLDSGEIKHSGLVEIRIKLKKPQVYLECEIAAKSIRGAVRKYKITLRPGAVRSRIIRLWKDTESISIRTLRIEDPFDLEFVSLVKFPLAINAWIIWKRLQHFKRALPKNRNLIWRAYSQTFNTQQGITNYQTWIQNNEPKSFHALDNDNSGKHLNLVIYPGGNAPSLTIEPLNITGKIFDLTAGSTQALESLKKTIQSDHSGLSEYFLFVTTDDRIASSAPQIINSALQDSNAEIFYTDEDRLIGNKRDRPEFKPAWNPEYFFESNYTGRAVIFASKHLKKLDLTSFSPSLVSIGNILGKAIIDNPSTPIKHIHSMCFHRGSETLTYRFRPPEKRVTRNWHLAGDEPSVDILIPTRDKLEILEPCIRSILNKSTYSNFNVSILNNNSQEAETFRFFEEIETHPKVRILEYPYPFNYSAINNFGASQSDSDVLVLLNNDIEVINPDWLEALVTQAMRSNIGCVGAKLYYPNGWIQHAGVILGIGDIAGHSHRFYPGNSRGYMNRLVSTQRVSAVTAACLAIQKSIYDQVNGLDEKNLTVAYNDVDFCLRLLEAGYHNIWTPKAELFHHESISRGHDDTPEKKRRYQKEVKYMKRRWKNKLDLDPYYHPALSHNREDFSLKS
jgi:GT2 family glycosyltransferase